MHPLFFIILIVVLSIGGGWLGFSFSARFSTDIVTGTSDVPKWLRAIVTAAAFAISLVIFGAILKPYRFVDSYEFAYVYDSMTGRITIPGRTGYITRTPFITNVHTIDTRPRQVCINVGGGRDGNVSSGVNQRVLNCKLVSFDPKGLALFLSWHGRGDYSDDLLNDLLKIYAYDGSGRSYPFLIVSDETRPVAAPAIGQPITIPAAQ